MTDLLTGLTTAQMLQRDQQSQAEYFRSSLIGWGMLLGLCLILVLKAMNEWRHR